MGRDRILGYKVRVVGSPTALREDVLTNVHKVGIRSHIEYVADSEEGFRGWRLGEGRSIGCLFVTCYMPNVWYDRTIGLSAWRWLRRDYFIDTGVVPVDVNESNRQTAQMATTNAVVGFFKEALKEAHDWERMTRKERRELTAFFRDLHRRAIAAPVAPELAERIWERLYDIDGGTYAGEVSTLDAHWRWYMK